MKRIAGVLGMVLGLGCGSDNSVNPAGPRLIVSLQAAEIAVARGSRTSVGAAVTRENGATSNVSITAAAPAGITVSIVNESSAGATATATLAISVGSGLNSGRYTIAVLGHALNYPDASANLIIDVNDSSPP